MRTLLGWALKLSFAGVLYVGMTAGFGMKLPKTILGYTVPESAQQFVDRTSQIADFGQKTQAGFKGIGDALK
jgi:hypothetical protein